jgi:nucleoside transporter
MIVNRPYLTRRRAGGQRADGTAIRKGDKISLHTARPSHTVCIIRIRPHRHQPLANRAGSTRAGDEPMNSAVRTRLSVMMFLQYFVWGAWGVAIGTYLLNPATAGGLNLSGSLFGWIGAALPIGAMISPLFIGLIADRLFSTEKVLAVLHLLGAGLLAWAAYTCAQSAPEIKGAFETAAREKQIGTGSLLNLIDRKTSLQTDVNRASGDEKADLEKRLEEFNKENGQALQEGIKEANETPAVANAVNKLFWTLLGITVAYAVCYMPTLMLTNSISFRNLSNPDKEFGPIRVLGTIGWIAAGWVVGLLINPVSPEPLYLAAGASVLLGLFCFVLPHTPPSGGAKTIGDTVGLPALAMLKDVSFLVFFVCAFLIQIALAFYYQLANKFLTDIHAPWPTALQTTGQVSEIFFMLILPFALTRLGTKWMLVIGMLAWCLRYLVFAWGYVPVVIGIGLPLHGICYDFFFVVAYLYVDRQAPINLRASAQGLITFITLGVGWFLGNIVAGQVLGAFTKGDTTEWTQVWYVPLAGAALTTVIFAVLFRPASEGGKPSAVSATEALETA